MENGMPLPSFEEVFDKTLLLIADETGIPPENLTSMTLEQVGIVERAYVYQILFDIHNFFHVQEGKIATMRSVPKDIDSFVQKTTIQNLAAFLHKRFEQILS